MAAEGIMGMTPVINSKLVTASANLGRKWIPPPVFALVKIKVKSIREWDFVELMPGHYGSIAEQPPGWRIVPETAPLAVLWGRCRSGIAKW